MSFGHVFLRKVFASAAAVATLGLGMASRVEANPPKSSIGRGLTTGENSLIKMFGDELDSSVVRIHAGPHKGNVIGQAFDKKNVAFYGHPYLSEDYSEEFDPLNYGAYVHETTHTWQYQTEWKYTDGHCPGGYYYELKDSSRLEDFCSESQAAIVEDYARRFIKPSSSPSAWYVSMCGQDTPENDARLIKVVETRFPNARKMRMELGRGETLPDARPLPPGSVCKKPDKPPGGVYPDGGHEGADGSGSGGDCQCPCQPKNPDKDPDMSPIAQPEAPEKTGKPTFFCETVSDAMTKIKRIADNEGLQSWPGFSAWIDEMNQTCVISIRDEYIGVITASAFEDGLIQPDALSDLAKKIVENTPEQIRAAVRANLSELLDQIVDKQKAEKAALKDIKSRQEAEKIIGRLETQLKDDPSLPDNSRSFVEDKIKILRDQIAKFDRKGAPSGGRKGPAQPQGQGTGKPRTPKPAAPPAPEIPMDPDRNIKKLIDSAFGAASNAPAAVKIPAPLKRLSLSP